MDAARLLPVFGALLFIIPLLWPVPEPGLTDDETVPMSAAVLYVFTAWTILIIVIALFGYVTRLWTTNSSPDGPGRG